MKRATAFLFGAVLALSSAAPLRAADTTVTISQGVDADTLNPLATTITPTFNVVQHVYERLADFGAARRRIRAAPRGLVEARQPDDRGVQAPPRRDVLERRPVHQRRRAVLQRRLDQEPRERLEADAVRARHRPRRDAGSVHRAVRLQGADGDPAGLAEPDLHHRREVRAGERERVRRRAPDRNRRIRRARVAARRPDRVRREPEVVGRQAEDRPRRLQADPRSRRARRGAAHRRDRLDHQRAAAVLRSSSSAARTRSW